MSAIDERDELPNPQSEEGGSTSRFTVRLDNFEGPFDLLLQLISQHELDVTDVALHRVTDEFLAYTKALGEKWDLPQVSRNFLHRQ